MSGQAGIYYYDDRPIDRSLADRLREGLSRQGPDGGSEHFGEGLLMVHCPFTFDPLSRMERQPYASPCGNWITFDGRLDNRDDLLLLVKDHLLDDVTDVALAMAAYEKWGEPGFNRLIGDWSLVLWDDARRSVILASDYMGVRPLFYFGGDGFIAWSSDLALLAEWMAVVDDLDNYYIAAFLTGSAKYDRTVYKGIWYVLCGHALRFSSAALTKDEFWKPPVDNRIRYQDDRDYEEQLLHLFREAVLARLRTDASVCCDLSGGLDSSSVTCMVHHLIAAGAATPKSLTTYSYFDPSMDDSKYIPIVERHCGLRGIHSSGCPSALSLEGGASPIPGPNVLRLAQRRSLFNDEGIRVNLTGLGGDLVMGNTTDDFEQLSDHLVRGAVMSTLKEAYEWSRALHLPFWWVLKFGLIPLMPATTQQKLFRQKSDFSAYAYHHLQTSSCLNQDFIARYHNMEIPRYATNYRKAAPGQRIALFGFSQYQAAHVLSTSSELESLYQTHPYCHRPLVEYVCSIPRRQLCRPGKLRVLMRRAFSGLLPHEVLNRRTKALGNFALDLSLQELCPELLRAGQFRTETAGYAKAGAMRGILEHSQDPSHKRSEITQLLKLEIWLRTRPMRRKSRPEFVAFV